MTPKDIMKRHLEYPNSTCQLIENYAFGEYQKAIEDLRRICKIVEVEDTKTTIIAIASSEWENFINLKNSHWYLNGYAYK